MPSRSTSLRPTVRGPRLTVERVSTVVRVAGEVDAASVSEFRRAVRWCDEDPIVQALDLTAVTFFDAAGVRCLVESAWPLRPHNLVIGSSAVRRTFELCELEFLLGPHGWFGADGAEACGAPKPEAN
ncbi:MAG: STAS domain-containing protein [Ilumatobacteraceae bacterium]|nr:STAS domain-containing protein [Ilumatobacteraceae bacterium]